MSAKTLKDWMWLIAGMYATVISNTLFWAPIVGQADHPSVKALWHQWLYWVAVILTGSFAIWFWSIEWPKQEAEYKKGSRRT